MRRLLKVVGTVAGVVALAACGGEETRDAAAPADSAAETTVSEAAEQVADAQSETNASADVDADVKVAAVLIYADWCTSCKIIEPKLDAVKAAGPIDGLQHVKLDYTARNQDALLAQADAVGVGDALREYYEYEELKTGVVLMVNLEDNAVTDDLTKDLSIEAIASTMAASVASL
ncbi:MAG: thioredoxin domain-containing protein [Pseudomonadota bacterium]